MGLIHHVKADFLSLIHARKLFRDGSDPLTLGDSLNCEFKSGYNQSSDKQCECTLDICREHSLPSDTQKPRYLQLKVEI